jgi:hypothetical protein
MFLLFFGRKTWWAVSFFCFLYWVGWGVWLWLIGMFSACKKVGIFIHCGEYTVIKFWIN